MRLNITREEIAEHHSREIAALLGVSEYEVLNSDFEGMCFSYDFGIRLRDEMSPTKEEKDLAVLATDKLRRTECLTLVAETIHDIHAVHLDYVPRLFSEVFMEVMQREPEHSAGFEVAPLGPLGYGVPDLVEGGYDLDEILDKIALNGGMSSLTHGEKRFLKKQSEK